MKLHPNLAPLSCAVLICGLSGLLTASCGPQAQSGASLPGADTACVAGSAQLAIGDAWQEILCGCQEPGGQVVGQGTAQVTCTVPVGTEVFFYFLGTKLKHQIVPSDSVSFASSPISDPSDKNPTRVHAFKLSKAGSYGFTDAFNLGVSGTLIAQ